MACGIGVILSFLDGPKLDAAVVATQAEGGSHGPCSSLLDLFKVWCDGMWKQWMTGDRRKRKWMSKGAKPRGHRYSGRRRPCPALSRRAAHATQMHFTDHKWRALLQDPSTIRHPYPALRFLPVAAGATAGPSSSTSPLPSAAPAAAGDTPARS